MKSFFYPSVSGSGGAGAVDSVNGQTGVVVLTKSDLSLGNVDNTSDANKPVSSATQTALNLKADASAISNIDNTSDLNKPISMATQTALNLKANLASPALTGVPVAPTASLNDNSTQVATTAYVDTSIAAIPDPIVYKGTWNATTNTPTLSDSDTGVEGFLYQVSVAGSVDFGAGSISFEVGDKVVNNGSLWQKWDLTDAVLSVNGQTGIVSLTSTNISEGTNLYFTDARARTASVADSITDGVTNIAPSQNAVFDALALKANLSGATFSGSISATNLSGTNTGDQDLSTYAPLASPALSGIPTAPTATGGTNTTQIATTAFVTSAVSGSSGANVTLSNLTSPTSINQHLSFATTNTFDVGTSTKLARNANFGGAALFWSGASNPGQLYAPTNTELALGASNGANLTLSSDGGTVKISSANAIDINFQRIVNVLNPTVTLGVANKNYVDLATAPKNCSITMNTPNGHGSTNTKIRRFTNTSASVGTDITYADSASLGGSFTINTTGVYAISYTDRNIAGLTTRFGISVNTSAPTTALESITYAQGFRTFTQAGLFGAVSGFNTVSITLPLTASDVVMAHTDGIVDSTDLISTFTITRVS